MFEFCLLVNKSQLWNFLEFVQQKLFLSVSSLLSDITDPFHKIKIKVTNFRNLTNFVSKVLLYVCSIQVYSFAGVG